MPTSDALIHNRWKAVQRLYTSRYDAMTAYGVCSFACWGLSNCTCSTAERESLCSCAFSPCVHLLSLCAYCYYPCISFLSNLTNVRSHDDNHHQYSRLPVCFLFVVCVSDAGRVRVRRHTFYWLFCVAVSPLSRDGGASARGYGPLHMFT